ncbi:MAG: fibronectin type III domain-containing protein, partial [Marinobacter sp.]|nr:fibronectin type III domain-containing protein [Marinobacter sp.]
SISLSEIQSYEVLYGTAADNLSELKVVDGSQTSTEISGLSSGTWYFSVRVVDINGLKSDGSAVQSYTVP